MSEELIENELIELEEQGATKLGDRHVKFRGKETVVYRTVDGRNWISSNQAVAFLDTTRTTAYTVIRKMEEAGTLRREAIRSKGGTKYIHLSDIDKIREEIHGIKTE